MLQPLIKTIVDICLKYKFSCNLISTYTNNNYQGQTQTLGYVEDTFAVWPHGEEKMEEFRQHSTLLLTYEIGIGRKIAFPDVLRKLDGCLDNTVYRKTTH